MTTNISFYPLLHSVFPSNTLESRRLLSSNNERRELVSSAAQLILKVVAAALTAFTQKNFEDLDPHLGSSASHMQGFLLYTLANDAAFLAEATALQQNLPVFGRPHALDKSIQQASKISSNKFYNRLKTLTISEKMSFLFQCCFLNASKKAHHRLPFGLEENLRSLVRFLKKDRPCLSKDDIKKIIPSIKRQLLENSVSLLQAEASLIRPYKESFLIKTMLAPIKICSPEKKVQKLHGCYFYELEAIFQRLFERESIVCLKVVNKEEKVYRYFFESAFDCLYDCSRDDPKTSVIVFEGTTEIDCEDDMFWKKVEEIGFHKLLNIVAAPAPQYAAMGPENESQNEPPLSYIQNQDARDTILYFRKIAQDLENNEGTSLFQLNHVYCSTLTHEGISKEF